MREVKVTRPYFDAQPDDDVAALAAEADRHPVFELLPTAATPAEYSWRSCAGLRRWTAALLSRFGSSATTKAGYPSGGWTKARGG